MGTCEVVMIAPRKQKRRSPVNSFLTKIKTWFKPKKPVKPKQPAYQPINHQHYRKLIGKLAKQAIAIQRKRRVKC